MGINKNQKKSANEEYKTSHYWRGSVRRLADVLLSKSKRRIQYVP